MPTRIVALGGGHGLYASLSALRRVSDDLTAIVTVADDGGSSGRLRDEMGIVPPGDLRMALSALCEDGEWGHMWRDVLQTRFTTRGALDGHALGNLLIAGLWERSGDVVTGLDWVGQLLRARGRVLPLADEPLEIAATVRGTEGVTTVTGQVGVATSQGVVESVSITPARPRVPAQTTAAIDGADIVILGPGSWYTSVLVHFLVEPVRDALVKAAGRCVLTLNIAYVDQETAGEDRVDDIRALRRLEPRFVPAAVLADTTHASDPRLREEVESWGSRLVVSDVKARQAVDRHDPELLADAYRRLLGDGGAARPAGEVAG